MIPKVATHILHHTSRAAAAVQNGTSQTIRNVLQIQSTGPSQSTPSSRHHGSGSSHWSNNGPGPGGSKFNPNNRFYTGYSGVGRAITQANLPATHDVTLNQLEERDELTVRPNAVPMRRRPRSHSLSLANHGRAERAESLGILKSVQLRAMHAFVASPFHNVEDTKVAPEHPAHARELSTVTSSVESLDLSMPPPATSSSPAKPVQSPSPIDAVLPQAAKPQEVDVSAEESDIARGLRTVMLSGNPDSVAELVSNFRKTAQSPTVKEFNLALEALYNTRRKGESLHMLMDVYNDMLQRSLVPNLRTYSILIEALADRDHEVQKAISSIRVRSGRLLFGDNVNVQDTEMARIKQLESENNFGSAMVLFEAALALTGKKSFIPVSVYLALLRSCAHHSNANSAIHVFDQLQKSRDIKTPPRCYLYLLSVFAKTKDLKRARIIFDDFRQACQASDLAWYSEDKHRTGSQMIQIQIWNKMIEANILCDDAPAALKLLEEMMDTKADPKTFGLADVPPTASSTYTQVISGFCQVNDVKSALSWFERLRAQPTPAHKDNYHPSVEPTQPDSYAWSAMINKLAECGMVEEMNQVFSSLIATNPHHATFDQSRVFNTNMKVAREASDSAVALASLDYAFNLLCRPGGLFSEQLPEIVLATVDLYVQHGGLTSAIQVLEWYATSQKAVLGNRTESPKQEYWGRLADYNVSLIKHTLVTSSQAIIDAFGPSLPFASVHRLMQALQGFDIFLGVAPMLATKVVGSYHLAKQNDTLRLTQVSAADLAMLGDAAPSFATAVGTEAAAPVLIELLRDLANAGVELSALAPDSSSKIIRLIADAVGQANLKELVAPLSPSCAQMVEAHYPEATSDDAASQTAASELSHDTLVDAPVVIDPHHSRSVDEFFHANSSIDVHTAYQRFLAGAEENRYPVPTTFAHLITALGRLGEMEKVKYLYTTCQRVLASLEKNKEWQTQSWFAIEDAMIIALAHAGDLNAAHLHRSRILEQGGAPSADAYGALIQYVKDTTDDTSSAMTLFQESQSHGVRPNIYLYNNIISKLAKARKADYALELFQQMKTNRVTPSSITYGALIAACARVGDHYSAEQLFTEMTQQNNFKPRVPPYNTMMQLYTTTKPSRERALFYFDAMRSAGVAPTAHTYKLLIDAYGTIEPLDMNSVNKVFKMLENDNKVQMQGSHWASVINAWGCASKNLDKAIEVFDSIASHPKVLRSSVQLPDAVCYEAMVNVLVIHRRTDLMAKYIDQLKASGVHMTAYIVNFLIKGHAIVGDLENARSVFEGLADPPLGYAAPNNHVPHEGVQAKVVSGEGVVYREPSTWETMIRAELGAGNRDNAIQLLERLRQRQYPEAVYQRICGIMLDDSVSPWAAELTPSSP